MQKICHVLVDYPHKIQNISPCSIHAYFRSIDVEHYIWLIRRYLTELDNHTLYLPLYYQQVISGIQRCKVKINGMDEGRKITMCAVYDSGLSCSAPFILARWHDEFNQILCYQLHIQVAGGYFSPISHGILRVMLESPCLTYLNKKSSSKSVYNP